MFSSETGEKTEEPTPCSLMHFAWQDYDFAERINCALAFFLNDLISIMDRGFVLKMVRLYCQLVSIKYLRENNYSVRVVKVTDRIRSLYAGSVSSLLILRVGFLRIICSHEHYITLNLPFSALNPPSPTPSISSTTSSWVSCLCLVTYCWVCTLTLCVLIKLNSILNTIWF